MVKRKDARSELQSAALALFQEKGFEQTTTAEIADRAGITERTLFRHFPDKKELLFDDAATGCEVLIDAVIEAPGECGAVEALFWAMRAFEPTMRERRSYTHPRFMIVSANPALMERELTKQLSLTEALKTALRKRGVTELPAALAARIGMAAFGDALEAWFDDPDCDYVARLDRSYDELKKLVALSPTPGQVART